MSPLPGSSSSSWLVGDDTVDTDKGATLGISNNMVAGALGADGMKTYALAETDSIELVVTGD